MHLEINGDILISSFERSKAVENLPDLAMCEKASPALGEMLIVVKESREDWIAEIVKHFTPSKEVVNSYLKSAAASHFLGRLIYAMNEARVNTFRTFSYTFFNLFPASLVLDFYGQGVFLNTFCGKVL